MNYGIPYMGSKSKIAEDIINFLPKGKRFVDLFGGGMAISHCALLSGKYESVYYNELNPLLPPLLKDAIAGKYNYNVFKPEFITREKFFELKEIDGYVKYIWSFGNNGDAYLFNKDIEKYKEACHNLVVFGEDTTVFLKLYAEKYVYDKYGIIEKCDIVMPSMSDINKRRLFIRGCLTNFEKKCKLTQLRRLQQLEQLQQLQQLERLTQLTLNTSSYEDYEYQDGDVVYCDPPYENTAKYNKEVFSHQEFYDWVFTRPYQVFFSSYDISDNRFISVWEKDKRSLLCANKKNTLIKKERIYSNMRYNNTYVLFS